jgi:hypothetical protein
MTLIICIKQLNIDKELYEDIVIHVRSNRLNVLYSIIYKNQLNLNYSKIKIKFKNI